MIMSRNSSTVIPKNKPEISFDGARGAVTRDTAAANEHIRSAQGTAQQTPFYYSPYAMRKTNTVTSNAITPNTITPQTANGKTTLERGTNLNRIYPAGAAPYTSQTRPAASSHSAVNGYAAEAVRPYAAPRQAEPRQTVREAEVKLKATREESIPNSAIRRVAPTELSNLEPTRQTMNHKTIYTPKESEKSKNKEGDLALSLQTKVVIAIFAAVIMIAFTVIFVNSALLNTLNAEIGTLQEAAQLLGEEASALSAQIETATSAETIIEYATSAGMVIG